MKQVFFFIVLVTGVVVGLYLFKSLDHTNTIIRDVVQVPVVKPVDPKPPIDLPVKPKPKTEVEPNVVDALKPVFREAIKNKKKVFLFVSMDACVWCDKMKKEVIPNVHYLSTYAFLETKDPTVAQAYKVDGFPTFILFDNKGNELKRTSGFMPPSHFQTWLDE